MPPFFPGPPECHRRETKRPAPKGPRWGRTTPPFFPDLSELSRRANGRQPSGATPLSPWRLWGEFEAFCCRAPTFAPALCPDAVLQSGSCPCRTAGKRLYYSPSAPLPFLGCRHCSNPGCRCQEMYPKRRGGSRTSRWDSAPHPEGRGIHRFRCPSLQAGVEGYSRPRGAPLRPPRQTREGAAARSLPCARTESCGFQPAGFNYLVPDGPIRTRPASRRSRWRP